VRGVRRQTINRREDTMSKKDFIRLANYLRNVKLSDEAMDAIVDFCKASNPHFKADVFLGYLKGECGPSGGKIKKV
jgi:hypothetical protein